MNAPAAPIRNETLRIAGDKVACDRSFEVRYPYTGAVVATVPKATVEQVRRAFALARQFRSTLTRYDRYRILIKAGELIAGRRDEIARLITLESGLCLKDTQYEVGRASDVLLFAANQALVDDGQVFSCDLTPHGRKRKVYTMREPLLGVISAITPFNHPLNQVIHKVAPAIATNNRVVLKPSEKTPLAAYLLAHALGKDVMRVDLAQVFSKYIGQTEEHLDMVFRDAKESGAVLLLDEADALFGKRSEIKDSHDRYANLDVAYLLQRLEDHDGLAILATNSDAITDDAAASDAWRRLRMKVVRFPRRPN